ncbi:Polynucleotide 5'-hydroxyl-kinase grc3 [Mortierella sp. AM989]|nr:Polynucleotide 5'-hydroxyl-kinase grc3 [Mortierella sp. AM989]
MSPPKVKKQKIGKGDYSACQTQLHKIPKCNTIITSFTHCANFKNVLPTTLTVRSTTATSTVTVLSSNATAAPVSAIAARRQQLMDAVSNIPTSEVEEHIQIDNIDDEEKASLDSGTSDDSDASDDLDRDDDDTEIEAKPNSKSSAITPQYERRDRKTHALAVVESISLAGSQRDKLVPQPTRVTSPGLKSQLELLLPQLSLADFDTVLAIQSASDCGIVGIEKVVPLFRGILSIKQTARLRGTEDEDKQAQLRFETYLTGFHPILEPTDSIAALKIPNTWRDAMQALIDATVDENGGRVKRPPVSVVCGGKKMGKSTFSRLTLNRMLNRYRKVAFIECDIGQSEFTPVGMVALHIIETPALGAPFTHPRQPHRAFFVGNSTPKDNPDYYMACIKELVKTYYSEVSHTRSWEDTDDDYHSDDDEDEHIPLIINTQGWIKGMGYDLLLQLLDYTAPSHIFGFHSPSVGDSNLPPTFFSALKEQAILTGRQNPTFCYVAAVALGDDSNLSPFTKYHPADHRALSLLSYFYLKQEQSSGSELINDHNLVWDFTQALVVRQPWCWNWSLAKGVWILFDQVPPSQILHVLNGSLVALTGDKEDPLEENNSNQGIGDSQSHNQSAEATEGQPNPPNYFPIGQYPPPPPEHTTCHGLAIIRSIQPSTQTLHILTPIQLSKLKKCNGIVKGAIHMPLHANLDHNEDNSTVPGVAGVPWKKVPYLNYETPSGNYGSQSPATGGQSPRLGFAPPVKIIGSDAKVTRKNLGRKHLALEQDINSNTAGRRGIDADAQFIRTDTDELKEAHEKQQLGLGHAFLVLFQANRSAIKRAIYDTSAENENGQDETSLSRMQEVYRPLLDKTLKKSDVSGRKIAFLLLDWLILDYPYKELMAQALSVDLEFAGDKKRKLAVLLAIEHAIHTGIARILKSKGVGGQSYKGEYGPEAQLTGTDGDNDF